MKSQYNPINIDSVSRKSLFAQIVSQAQYFFAVVIESISTCLRRGRNAMNHSFSQDSFIRILFAIVCSTASVFAANPIEGLFNFPTSYARKDMAWLSAASAATQAGCNPSTLRKTQTFPQNLSSCSSDTFSQIITEDFNRDGHLDFVAFDSDYRVLLYYVGNSVGAFQLQSRQTLTAESAIMKAGNFNGNNRPDLIVVGTNGITVLLNQNGTGFTAAAPVPLARTTGVFGITVNDYNQDGRSDVIVSQPGPFYLDTVTTLYLRTPNGSFTSSPLAFGNGIATLTADFNGDGRADVLAQESNYPSHQIWLGNGSGQFTKGEYVALSVYVGFWEVVDFNRDGMPDLIGGTGTDRIGNETTESYRFVVFLNNGRGNFTSRVSPLLRDIQTTGRSGDFNKDGIVDVVLEDSRILLSDGSGGLCNVQAPFFNTSQAIVPGDFDKDGRSDVVTSSFIYSCNSGELDVWINNGTRQNTLPTITPATPVTLTYGSTQTIPIATVSDQETPVGQLQAIVPDTYDLITVSNVTNVAGTISATIRVVTNPPYLVDGLAIVILVRDAEGAQGIGRFLVRFTQSQNTPPIITPATPLTLSQGLNATSSSTIATVNDSETPAGNLTVTATSVPAGITLTNIINTNGTISARIAVDCGVSVGQKQVELTVTDANGGSSKANLFINVTPNKPPEIRGALPNAVTIKLGFGYQHATFDDVYVWDDSAPNRFPVVRPTITTSPGFTGQAFIFVALPGGGMYGLLRITDAGPVGTHTITLTGTDNCGLTTQKTIQVTVTGESDTCRFPRLTKKQEWDFSDVFSATTGDFTADGKLDLAVSRTTDATISMYRGDGTGGFTLAQTIDAKVPRAILKTGDFNGDRNDDIFFSNEAFQNPVTAIAYNQSGRGFQVEVLSVPLIFQSEVGDLNKDGRTDVAYRDVNLSTVRVLLNQGNNSFALKSALTISGRISNMLIGDFDADTNQDIVLGDYFTQNLFLGKGDGNGNFQSVYLGGTGLSSPTLIGKGDFNKDGKLDYAYVTNTDDENVVRNSSFALYVNSGWVSPFSFPQTNAYSRGFEGDFNRDGVDDLLWGDRFALGAVGNSFCAAPKIIPTGLPFAVADFDGDGGTDVVVFDKATNKLSIWTHSTTTNIPPKFETIASLTIDKGYELASRIIGKISDVETPLQQLKLEAVSVPMGMTVSRLSGSSGDVYATISADCVIRAGEYVMQLKVTDGGGASATANLKIIVRENAPLAAPVYQDVVITSFNTEATVQPVILQTKNGQATMDDSNLQFSASAPDFPGRIQMNGSRPFISEATKPGNYTVTVTARERCGLSASTKFNLTVQPPDACPSPSFGSSSEYGVGNNPRAMVLGDFNNDKQVDLLVGNMSDNTGGNGDLSLLLNTGNGTFGSAANFRLRDDVHANPRSVAVGDFNNDGNLDAVVGNAGFTAPGAFGSVILMMGNGKGNLTKSAEISLGENSVGAQLALGDFNKDGRLDVAVINTLGGGLVFVLLGDGSGNFVAVRKFAVGFPPRSPFTIATGDFNKDNNLDIVVADEYALNLNLGDGQGNFSAPRIFFQGLGETPLAIVVADFNRDNNPDVATLNQRNRIVIKLGDGKGDFPQTTAYQLNALEGAAGYGLAAGDFDGDGKIDLVATGSNSIVTLTGDGNGGFCTATRHQTGLSETSIITGDLNGDGLADVVITKTLQQSVRVLLNTTRKGSGCETPVFNSALNYSANTRPYGLTSDDFNGDGKVDLATTNLWDNTVTVLLSEANGFTKQMPITVGVLPNYIAARDLNSDGKLDLAVVNRGSDVVTILLGNGNGTFTKKGDYPVGNKSTGVAIGDFNRDSKLDLILPNDGLGNAVVLDGNGDGSFGGLRYIFAGGSPQPGVVADFNKDGNTDVAFPQYFSGEVAILFGNGNGQFQSPIYVSNLGGTGVEAITLGDVNGDGNVDLAVTNTTTNQIFTILSDGRGGFIHGNSVATGSNYPASIVIADFNRDGQADIAVGGYSDNQVRVFKGLANGFDTQSPLVLPVGNDPLSLLTNDFNGDGKPDLAIANQGSGTVSVLLNGCVN